MHTLEMSLWPAEMGDFPSDAYTEAHKNSDSENLPTLLSLAGYLHFPTGMTSLFQMDGTLAFICCRPTKQEDHPPPTSTFNPHKWLPDRLSSRKSPVDDVPSKMHSELHCVLE